jgi:hypothetical protein
MLLRRLLQFDLNQTDRLPRRELRQLERWLSADRRDGARTDVTTHRVVAMLTPTGPGRDIGPVIGAVRDASADGLSVLSPLPLDPGESVRLTLRPARHEAKAIEVLCTIRWSRPEGDQYVLGCALGVRWDHSLVDLLVPDRVGRAA